MAIKINQEIDKKFRVVLIGDSYVGKDELLNRLCHLKNAPSITNPVPFLARTVRICGKQVQLQIWNVSSHDVYFPLAKMYTRGASGAIVVYDVTSRDSFERIHRCFNILDPETPTILLGNKCDKTNREVTTEEGEKLASEKGIRFLETSAKNDLNVEEAFTILARDMLLRRDLERFEKLMTPMPQKPKIEPKFSLENSTFSNILRFGVEENYHVRVMLVGNEGAGKSTLLKRLLKIPVKINTYDSTNGIDVHIHSCDVDIETGAWCVNETNETGILAIAKLLRYIGGVSNTMPTNHNFHLRVAKMLTNMHVRRCETINNAWGSVSVQMEKNSLSKTVEESNKQTATGESDVDVPDIDMSNNCDENENAVLTPMYRSIDCDDIDPIVTKAKALVASKENPKARVDFYDFAGQLVFHASHPTFLSSKAIYMMAFDLNKFNTDRRTRTVDEVHTSGNGEVHITDMESIFFWLNIVYMFAISKQNIRPHVILVGTHADMLPKASHDQVAASCFREIRSLLANSPLKQILSDKEFVVDNTKKTDPCFNQLQTEILNLAQLQAYWGVQTPSRWLLLEREIHHAKDSGLKVLSIGKIRGLNSGLEIQIPDEEELQMFLQFLHDSGEVIYFNEPTLKDYIVLDPVWLIDALKAFITADRFAIRSPKHADKWKLFCETGIVHKSTIIDIFKENKDLALLKNSEHVLRLMEKFLFIASPVGTTGNLNDKGDINLKTDVVYIVPSMVQKPGNKELITSPEGLSSTTVFCMVSQNNFLPSAVFHKLLAKCTSKWEIVEQSGRKQIFCDVCKFNLDQRKHYKLIIVSVKHAVHAKIISYIDTTRPQPTLCKLVHEFLIEALKNILTCMGFSDEFRTCIQCPRFSLVNSGGYIDTDLMDNQEYVTCDECQISHVMLTADLIDCWTDKEPTLDNEIKAQTQSPVQDIKDGTNEGTI